VRLRVLIGAIFLSQTVNGLFIYSSGLFKGTARDALTVYYFAQLKIVGYIIKQKTVIGIIKP
jgi:hypothetical protein